MKAENRKSVNPEESQNAERKLNSSRRAFAKAGAVAPVLMTLTSKSALGSIYQCTVSGIQSGNVSSHKPTTVNCAVGISPGGWWQNACKLKGNPDGGLDEWCAAGIAPWSIKVVSGNNKIYYQGQWINANTSSCTLVSGCASWSSIFSAIKTALGVPVNTPTFGSIFGDGDTRTIWDVLNQDQGSLKWSAICDYLNAMYFQKTGHSINNMANVYSAITPSDIVNLYKLATGVITSFTTSHGVLVTSTFNGGTNGSGAVTYLKGIHP